MTSAIARVTDEALKAPVPEKIKPVPRKVRHALDLMFRGECKDIKAAAAQANLSREHLSRSLRLPHVQAFIARKSRETVANHTIRASARLGELIDSASDHVSLDATKHTLGIGGIRPPSDGTNISIINNIAPGYVVKLRHVDDAGEGAKVIEHEAVQP
jgi:hypothetical protein